MTASNAVVKKKARDPPDMAPRTAARIRLFPLFVRA